MSLLEPVSTHAPVSESALLVSRVTKRLIDSLLKTKNDTEEQSSNTETCELEQSNSPANHKRRLLAITCLSRRFMPVESDSAPIKDYISTPPPRLLTPSPLSSPSPELASASPLCEALSRSTSATIQTASTKHFGRLDTISLGSLYLQSSHAGSSSASTTVASLQSTPIKPIPVSSHSKLVSGNLAQPLSAKKLNFENNLVTSAVVAVPISSNFLHVTTDSTIEARPINSTPNANSAFCSVDKVIQTIVKSTSNRHKSPATQSNHQTAGVDSDLSRSSSPPSIESDESGNTSSSSSSSRSWTRFICPTCMKPFPSQSSMSMHALIHTDSKPFACPHVGCTKRFRQKGHMTSHYRRHTGEKPFRCNAVISSDQLTAIGLSELLLKGDQQHKVCGKRFKDRSGLNTHLRRAHNLGMTSTMYSHLLAMGGGNIDEHKDEITPKLAKSESLNSTKNNNNNNDSKTWIQKPIAQAAMVATLPSIPAFVTPLQTTPVYIITQSTAH